MPDPKLVERAKAAATSETASPELRAKATRWLAEQKVSLEAPAEEPVSGFDYAQYQVPEHGSDIVGKGVAHATDDRHPVEVANERLGLLNDEKPDLRSASKRASLYAAPLYEGPGAAPAPEAVTDPMSGAPMGMGVNGTKPLASASPFAYYEPKPDRIVKDMQSYRASLPEPQRKEVDSAIADIQANGTSSRHYQEAADRLWLETRSEFERDGVPVQRLEYAQPTGYRTGVNKAASLAAPYLYGADQAMTFGLGSALWPTWSQDIMSGTSPEQRKVVERLRQRGVLPGAEDARGQETVDHGALAALGGINGLILGGFGGKVVKAGVGTEALVKGATAAPAWLKGTTLGARMARAAAGGAVASGLTGAGQQTVTEGFEAANGGEASLGDVASRAATDAAIGGVVSGAAPAVVAGVQQVGKIPGALQQLGEKAQTALRSKPGIGEDVNALEAAGGRTDFLRGAVRSPEGEALAAEAAKPIEQEGIKRTLSQRETALKPVVAKALDDLQIRQVGSLQTMEAENRLILRNIANKSEKPQPLFDELVNTVRSRANVPFAESAVYKKALDKIADIKPMLRTDPAVAARKVVSADELRKLGYDTDALLQDAYKGSLAGRDPKNIVFTVDLHKLSPTQLDDATQGLSEYIKWGKDAGAKDSKLREMYAALVKTRKLFGDQWAALKDKHDKVFQALDADKEALGLTGKDAEGPTQNMGARAYDAVAAFGKGNPERDAGLLKALRDSPAMQKRLETYLGNEAYSRLPTGISGGMNVGSGGVRGAVGSLATGSALRFDPIFGMMRNMKVNNTVQKALDASDQQLRALLQSVVGQGVELPESLIGTAASAAAAGSSKERKRHE